MIHDANYWLDRAEEAHTKADQMLSADCRRSLLVIAESYHQMAARAEQRQRREAEHKARVDHHQATEARDG